MTISKNHAVVEDAGLYKLMSNLISKYHPHLAEAEIVLMWRYGFKPNKEGRLVLGKCKLASDFDKALKVNDFIILLNAEAWKEMTPGQRTALLDHELCHAMGEEKDDGSYRYWIKKHDLEEFRDVVDRHGIWKEDISEFVKVAFRKMKPSLHPVEDDAEVTDEENEEEEAPEEKEEKPVKKLKIRKRKTEDDEEEEAA